MNDKTLHFIAGCIISAIFGNLVYPFFGVIMATFIGGLKEIAWDLLLDKGTPECRDWLYTVAGGFWAYATLILYDWVVG